VGRPERRALRGLGQADPARFLLPYLERERLRPGVDPAEAADYVSRMLLSFTASPGRWDLTDRAQVAELVRTELVAGILEPAETV